jgi:hypothetical protein
MNSTFKSTSDVVPRAKTTSKILPTFFKNSKKLKDLL